MFFFHHSSALAQVATTKQPRTTLKHDAFLLTILPSIQLLHNPIDRGSTDTKFLCDGGKPRVPWFFSSITFAPSTLGLSTTIDTALLRLRNPLRLTPQAFPRCAVFLRHAQGELGFSLAGCDSGCRRGVCYLAISPDNSQNIQFILWVSAWCCTVN